MDVAAGREWVVLLPVKSVGASKSRLVPAFPDAERRAALVRAMRHDTLGAILATTGVVGVVAAVDRLETAHELGTGVDVVVQQEVGLNAALRAADSYAIARFPGAARIAVVGDLPGLTPDSLLRVLTAAARHARSFVADLDGTGTTMLAVTDGPLEPSFGSGSAARHGERGTSLPADEGARHDVDLPSDLTAAAAGGFGPATRAALTPPSAAGRPRA